jgi:hypothetical protein
MLLGVFHINTICYLNLNCINTESPMNVINSPLCYAQSVSDFFTADAHFSRLDQLAADVSQVRPGFVGRQPISIVPTFANMC